MGMSLTEDKLEEGTKSFQRHSYQCLGLSPRPQVLVCWVWRDLPGESKGPLAGFLPLLPTSPKGVSDHKDETGLAGETAQPPDRA